MKSLSVFLPSYNEGKVLFAVASKVAEFLPSVAERYELIIVNDGSRDSTLESAQNVASKFPFVRVLNHESNRGYGAALRTGFYESRFEWIAFTDADGQFDFTEIVNLIGRQRETNADLVVGFYRKRAVHFYRRLNSFLWQTVIFILFNLRIRDIDCGFKLVRREVIKNIPRLESERGAFISTEFLVKAKKSGFKIVEVGVHHYPRKSGTGTGANLDVIIRSFIDLIRLWRKLRR